MSIKQARNSLKRLFSSKERRYSINDTINETASIQTARMNLRHAKDKKERAFSDFLIAAHIDKQDDNYRKKLSTYYVKSSRLLLTYVTALTAYDALFQANVHSNKDIAVVIHLERLKLLRTYKHTARTLRVFFKDSDYVFIEPFTPAQYNTKRSQYMHEHRVLIERSELPPQINADIAQPPTTALRRFVGLFAKKERTHHIDATPPGHRELPTYDESEGRLHLNRN